MSNRSSVDKLNIKENVAVADFLSVDQFDQDVNRIPSYLLQRLVYCACLYYFHHLVITEPNQRYIVRHFIAAVTQGDCRPDCKPESKYSLMFC